MAGHLLLHPLLQPAAVGPIGRQALGVDGGVLVGPIGFIVHADGGDQHQLAGGDAGDVVRGLAQIGQVGLRVVVGQEHFGPNARVYQQIGPAGYCGS